MSTTRTSWTLCLLVLAAVGLPAAGQESAPANTALTPAEELRMGDEQELEFLRYHPLSDDPALMSRLEEVGRRIAEVSDRPDIPYRFNVVQVRTPHETYQAWSMVNGAFLVSEPLMELYPTDDELAFAIGHELAHVALRHHVSGGRLGYVTEDDAVSEKERRDRWLNRFNRELEMEADQYAALYAVRAKYRFTAGPEALRRLSDASQGQQEDAAHPDFAVRISALEASRVVLEESLDDFHSGVAHLQAGDFEEAIEELRLFAAQFPQSVAGQVNLGAAYLARVRADAGTPSELAETLPILPDPDVVIRGMYDRADLQSAGRHFRRALEVQPGNTNALAGLALIDLREGEPDRAVERLKEALKVEPENPYLVLCLGNARFLNRDPLAAADLYLMALRLREDWGDARNNLALAYEDLERFDDARKLWSALLESDRHRADARTHIEELDAAEADHRN